MSYLVLARKWRPQTFAEVVGQEHVTRTLTNAIAQQRIHHAFLFSGARGVGKTTAARILAKALCCEKGPTPTPCNECELCREITGGTAVDVQEIDGASNNSVDEIRQLRENVKYQPARARRKIFIIDEVHMLSQSAFNALLKTLEEPPPHVTFIFATTEPHKIPITILSRCQRYDFKLIPTPRLVEHLRMITTQEGITIDAGALGLLAREAAGSVRDALSLLDQMIAYVGADPVDEARVAEVLGLADRSVLFELSGAVLARDARRGLEILAQVFERGADLGQFARAFAEHLRDLHVTKVCGGEPEGLVEGASADLEELRARAGRTDAALLGALFERAARAIDEVARSPLPRHTFEAALLDLCRVEPLVPLGDLLQRLEDLEARLAGGAGGTPRAVAPPAGEPRGPSRGGRAAAASHDAGGASGGSPRAAVAPRAPASRTGAAAPPASASGPVVALPAAGEVARRWGELCAAIEGQDAPLWGIVAAARPVAWDARCLTLGFRTEAEASLARTVTAKLQRVTGAAKVEIVVGAAAAPLSVRETEEHQRREERERLKREARAHPAYKDALDVFKGAQEKEIKVDES